MKKIFLFVYIVLLLFNYHLYLTSHTVLVRDDMHRVTVMPITSSLYSSMREGYFSVMHIGFNFFMQIGFSSLVALQITVYFIYILLLIVFMKLASLRCSFTGMVAATFFLAVNPLSFYLSKNLIYFVDQVIWIMFILICFYKKEQKLAVGIYDICYVVVYFYCLSLYDNFILYALIFSVVELYMFVLKRNKKRLLSSLLLFVFFVFKAEEIFYYILFKADYVLEGDKGELFLFLQKSWTLFAERLVFNITLAWSIFYATVFVGYLFYTFARLKRVLAGWHILLLMLALLPALAVLLTIYLPVNRGIQAESAMIMDIFLSFVLGALMFGELLSFCTRNITSKVKGAIFALLFVVLLTGFWFLLKKEIPYVRFTSKYQVHLKTVKNIAVALNSLKEKNPSLEAIVVSYGEDDYEALEFVFQYYGIKFEIFRRSEFSHEIQSLVLAKKPIIYEGLTDNRNKIFDLYILLNKDKPL